MLAYIFAEHEDGDDGGRDEQGGHPKVLGHLAHAFHGLRAFGRAWPSPTELPSEQADTRRLMG